MGAERCAIQGLDDRISVGRAIVMGTVDARQVNELLDMAAAEIRGNVRAVKIGAFYAGVECAVNLLDPKIVADHEAHASGLVIYSCGDDGGCAAVELLGNPVSVEALFSTQPK